MYRLWPLMFLIVSAQDLDLFGLPQTTSQNLVRQKPTLSLVPVTTQKSTFVMCVIKDFYPRKLTVQWKENDANVYIQSKLEYEQNAEGLYTAYSLYKVGSETLNTNTNYTCEVTHQQEIFTVRKNFNAKLSLEIKPPSEKELFDNDRVVLEAVVSGDAHNAVEEASLVCKVMNGHLHGERGVTIFSQDISQFKRVDKITVDTKQWFDGETVTCTIHDMNNHRHIKQEIRIDEGDGRTPSVFIYNPDRVDTDSVSLVCEVSSTKLGSVYIMWKVDNSPYIKGSTSAPIHRGDSTSVLSILTITKQDEDLITCAVMYANMINRTSTLQVSTSRRRKLPELSCD